MIHLTPPPHPIPVAIAPRNIQAPQPEAIIIQTPNQATDSISIRFAAKKPTAKTGKAKASPKKEIQTEKAVLSQADVNQQVVDGSKRFANKMLASLADSATAKSTIISPANTFMLLNLLQLGAKADTSTEIRNALGYGNTKATQDQLTAGVKSYIQELENLMSETGITLKQAYGIWAKPGEEWKASFLQRLGQLGGQHGDLVSADTINSWCKEKTNGKIKTIVTDNDIRTAVSVLASATYLLSNWRTQFDEKKTDVQEFNGLAGTTRVKMMHSAKPFSVIGNDKFTAISLPYGKESNSGKELKMSFFLPQGKNSLKQTYQALFAQNGVQTALSELQDTPPKKVLLSLPKFVIESETDTKAVLEQMGMSKAFSGQANFEDMMKKVQIGKMKQKAFIDVNEKGTEAAAVDVAIMTRSAVMPTITPSLVFDRPFIGVIHDQDGRVLFVNTITDLPNAK
jgi:serine protease inhibitor